MSLQRLLRHIRNSFLNLGRTLSQWLSHFLRRGLGGLFRVGQGRQAGFVLPTVTMVMLVVSLLTLAMLLRSTDRGKNAQNFRVNEATLNAAAPALDRAKAKIEKLFEDPTLPRATPTDESLLRVFEGNSEKYIFGDETPLKLVFNIDGDNKIGEEDQTVPTGQSLGKEWKETLTTAWKFPVDTDNNGKFDTFTLYGIYFRNPSTDGDGFNRQRNPLEARTPPMAGALGDQCATSVQTSASLVGNSGWFQVNGVLKKSFYVYALNVPITTLPNNIPSASSSQYEVFSGNGGFSALEYQQDRSRIPLSNNAAVYEGDLEMLPGAGLTLNGRVFTNSNFLLGQQTAEAVQLFLVSSPKSCYYQAESSKVLVGGNVGNGRVNDDSNQRAAVVDRFKGSGVLPDQDSFANGQNTTNQAGGNNIAYNAIAYEHRLNLLIEAAEARSTLTSSGTSPNITLTYSPSNKADPEEVQDRIKTIISDDPTLNLGEVRTQELHRYFKARTRRVPFREVSGFTNPDAIGTYTKTNVLQENPLRPPDVWMFPVNPNNNTTSNTNFNLRLTNCNGAACLPETDPQLRGDAEYRLGDRILVGNNLPRILYTGDPDNPWLEGENAAQPIKTSATATQKWLKTTGNAPAANTDNNRLRKSQVQDLADVGDTSRDGFWERDAASKEPENALDNSGGLRIVTGAGIYLPRSTTGLPTTAPPATPPTPIAHTTIWPDYLPVPLDHDDVFYHPAPSATTTIPYASSTSQAVNDSTSTIPYLRMRATVAYHITQDAKNSPKTVYDPTSTPVKYPRPIACISSYYDPTNSATAKNGDIDNSPEAIEPAVPGTGGKSNNGTVYPWKTTWESSSSPGLNLGTSFAFTHDGTFYSYSAQQILNYQAQLQYPNGRWVNETLYNAMHKIATSDSLTLSERSALDAAFCSLSILAGASSTDTLLVKHGDIYETAFLDGREIKAIEDPTNSDPTNYDLSIEERQPLEIRATVLNLGTMRTRQIPSTTPQDYLIPNTGIIYATREDALPDRSNTDNPEASGVDFILDPTRRPNGILLTNGSRLDREVDDRQEEKGFILATNLPVYILGDFNKHQSPTGTARAEFTDTVTDLTKRTQFYGRSTLDPNFACRPNGALASCTQGDTWRAATILSDTITLLSNNFKVGFRSDGDYDLRNNLAYVGDFAYVSQPFDLNSNGDTTDTVTINELIAGFDLNGDGDLLNNVSVKEDIIPPNRVPLSLYNRRKNGFFDNNFVTSRYFTDANYTGTDTTFAPANDANGIRYSRFSSYFNNFVTPIQRRGTAPEYLMEICRKIPVSQCTPDDWVVVYSLDGDADFTEEIKEDKIDLNGDGTPETFTDMCDSSPLRNCIDLNGDRTITTYSEDGKGSGKVIKASYLATLNAPITNLKTGTTARAIPDENKEDRRYARRVAFERDTTNSLTSTSKPKPLGIDSNNKITRTAIDNEPNALMFHDIDGIDGSTTLTGTDQPLAQPILQLQLTTGNQSAFNPNEVKGNVLNDDGNRNTNWLIPSLIPSDTGNIFNLVSASGDSPGRPIETNGGIANYFRFLENWNDDQTNFSGSIIQLKHSSYGTAPFWPLLGDDSRRGGIFNYRQGYRSGNSNFVGTNQGSRIANYTPPKRSWGFDVALLTQQPDLFSQRFTVPPSGPPNEFLRQTSRDDRWVQSLLCAAQSATPDTSGGKWPAGSGYDDTPDAQYNGAPYAGINYNFTISSDQRPQQCPVRNN